MAADGTVACLDTDFGLLIRHVDAKIELPVPVLRSSELRHLEFAAAGIDSICVEWASATNQLTLHLRGHADHLTEWHFENRPGQRLAYSSQGGTRKCGRMPRTFDASRSTKNSFWFVSA